MESISQNKEMNKIKTPLVEENKNLQIQNDPLPGVASSAGKELQAPPRCAGDHVDVTGAQGPDVRPRRG